MPRAALLREIESVVPTGDRGVDVLHALGCCFILGIPKQSRCATTLALQRGYSRDGGLAGAMAVGAVLAFKVDNPPRAKERVRSYLLEKRRIEPVTKWWLHLQKTIPPRSPAAARPAS